MSAWNLVRRGAYHDSVTLMRLTADMEAVPGVTRAAAMMGTPQNLALLRDAGLLAAEGETAAPTDLVIAVIADDAAAARAAGEAAERALARGADPCSAVAARPRSAARRARGAAGREPGADLGARALRRRGSREGACTPGST